MPALRGHHLICLHFFDGEGYSPHFTENLRTVRQKAGHLPVEICSGPDDVCAACPYLKDRTCTYRIHAEGEITAMDRRALELLTLSPGDRTAWEDIRKAVPGIFIQWHADYCKDCDWITACGTNTLFRSLQNSKR